MTEQLETLLGAIEARARAELSMIGPERIHLYPSLTDLLKLVQALRASRDYVQRKSEWEADITKIISGEKP